jgi:hypothetical protein
LFRGLHAGQGFLRVNEFPLGGFPCGLSSLFNQRVKAFLCRGLVDAKRRESLLGLTPFVLRPIDILPGRRLRVYLCRSRVFK